MAHLLGAAIVDKYKDAKLTIGPAIDNGFYYDFDTSEKVTDADLPKLEKKMKQILKEWDKYEEKTITEKEALEMFKDNIFKKELVTELVANGETLKIVKWGDFVDLCEGGHADTARDIKPDAFKLTSIAASYWKGNEKNPSLTRIYGLGFNNKKELDEYIEYMEEMKKRDHRVLGEQLEMFTFSKEVGPGLPLWLPNGERVRMLLEKWVNQKEKEAGYENVSTPTITKEKLFYTSTHLPHYSESMFAPMNIDGENYYIKPMNCPFHHKIFDSKLRSYRDLPVRISEYGTCHRYEDSGSLIGTMRTRSMKMNDGHIYCSRYQVIDEFLKVVELQKYYYKHLGINDFWVELSLREEGSDKYHGDAQMWKDAEKLTREAIEKSGMKYKIIKGGAAFYGPKIDFQIKSSLGREFTITTSQIDLFMGEKFGLKFKNEKGEFETPVIIHRAPLGTHERFIGFLLEHFSGRLPMWLAPEQVRVLTVSESVDSYSKKVKNILDSIVLDKPVKYNELRYTVDNSNESIGKKIRNAELKKIPIILVIGGKDEKNNTVNLRINGEEKSVKLDMLSREINGKDSEKKSGWFSKLF